MESKRAFLAIILSVIILVGYQYLFVPRQPQVQSQQPQVVAPATDVAPKAAISSSPAVPQAVTQPSPVALTLDGRDIPVETALYSALVSENGGGIKSFRLKNYLESLEKDADFKELIKTDKPRELPLYFSWGVEPAQSQATRFAATSEAVSTADNQTELTMRSQLPSGVEVVRTMHFRDDSYLMELQVDVVNRTDRQIQGIPYLSLTNLPFSQDGSNRFLFHGPALFQNGSLEEVKIKDLQKGKKTVNGNVQWVGYEDTYFMCGIIPESSAGQPFSDVSVVMSLDGEEKVQTLLASSADMLPPQGVIRYTYKIFFGPKELNILKKADANLANIVNFGIWDILAKPTLHLLNFFYRYIHNYGIAIILVTILIKLLFWPIATKGMKSMKTMQKLQPKMAKLKEKYANDKERLNQEMMQLYKTYKVNPIGGCLPMVLQIPVFFALYKVLLQTIELRHAPFMLWINDLSAPDRLFIGVDIPYLGGLPVLTLLMGASMFLQQRMTPSTADPTQQKVMMFLPVVFTFMFLNFASGLVLYWFVNNLLAIAQQYVINKQMDAAEQV